MNYRTEQEVDPQVDPVELVLPPSSINEFGITVKTMRCLEVPIFFNSSSDCCPLIFFFIMLL